ncbi:MAG: hypothetical protein Q9190_002993 [Brigantiaea leucoxantha]
MNGSTGTTSMYLAQDFLDTYTPSPIMGRLRLPRPRTGTSSTGDSVTSAARRILRARCPTQPPSIATSAPTSAQQSYYPQLSLGHQTDSLGLPHQHQPQSQATPVSPPNPRKRKAPGSATLAEMQTMSSAGYGDTASYGVQQQGEQQNAETVSPMTAPKKSRTNTPWTPAEEQRLKTMRDAGNSWSEIAKTFPNRTEGSVKKHWYKDMHYADFAEDESAALFAAIKEYEASKWKVIGQKVGKPAKACEQYAKEHFRGQI